MKNFDLSADFLSYFNSGNVKVTCDGAPTINFMVDDNTRIVDVTEIPISLKNRPGFFKQLSEAKTLAKSLSKQNITLEIRLQGNPVLKLGKNANPKLAKIVTLSNDIEITDVMKLKKLNDF
ncbi:MAG: hypothetical protein K5777_06830 [Nitrosopumilus sp.]|nr:hypothetical protein [Nitrosopumilus sp.]